MKKFNNNLNSVFSKEKSNEILLDKRIKRFIAKDLIYLEVEKLRPNNYQPRKIFDEQSMEELRISIAEQGILQPILARYNEAQDYYEIIAGERRLLAAKSVPLTHVPVLLANISDEEASIFAIVENIQRKDLSLIEEAESYNRLINEFKLTHEDVSKKVGKSRSTITNLLRILNLPDCIKSGIIENKIQFGHAKIILSIDNDRDKEKFYMFIVQNKLSVRDCEKQVLKFKLIEKQDYSFTEKNQSISKNASAEYVKKDIVLKLITLLGSGATVKDKTRNEVIIKIKNAIKLKEKLDFLLKQKTQEYIEVI